MSQDSPKPQEKRIAMRMRVKKRLVKAVEVAREERVEEEAEKDARDEEVRKRFEEVVGGMKGK